LNFIRVEGGIRMEKVNNEVAKYETKIEFAKTGRQRCTAKSKSTQFQCKNWAEPNSTKCRFHGGKTPARREDQKLAMKGNTHALTHGIYSNQLLTPEEFDFYHNVMEMWTEEYKLDTPNQLLLDRALRNYIKQARKDTMDFENETGFNDKGVILDHDSKFQKYMQMLGLDRKFNMTLQKEEEKVADLASLLSGLVGGKNE
jgi:hypothetical protein